MTNIDEENLKEAFRIISQIDTKIPYDYFCQIDEEKRRRYQELLNKFKELHEKTKKDTQISNLHNQKGAALEKLVECLFQISGNIFRIERNVLTNTNEIDDIITLNSLGKTLLSNSIINKRLENFIGECKNYNKKVSVTYVGKFCSLLLTTNIKLGILFSYHGISGKNWNDASGLVKKFYLHKEKEDDRYCIINFSIKEFEAILEGDNLLNIIDRQLEALKFDTDYLKYISCHPAESNV